MPVKVATKEAFNLCNTLELGNYERLGRWRHTIFLDKVPLVKTPNLSHTDAP
jgi:hypothetical protein